MTQISAKLLFRVQRVVDSQICVRRHIGHYSMLNNIDPPMSEFLFLLKHTFTCTKFVTAVTQMFNNIA